jgi:hypothetical protein
MPWLLVFVIIAMVAAYIFTPKPSMENAKSASLDEFSFPTNSNGRVVPEVFGTVEIHGNILWYGDLYSVPITQSN